MEEVKKIIDSLSDPLPAIRTSAVQEAGKMKLKEAFGKLTELLEKDESPLVRDNAAFALGELGDNRAVPYLIKALRDSDEWVRKSAAKALGILKSKESFDALCQCLNDQSPTVRRTVARALAQIGDKRAIGLIKPLLNDENVLVKKYARDALNILEK